MVLGRNFAVQMQTMFALDLAESDAITRDRWRKRPWAMRLKERIARIGEYWL